MRYVWRSGLAVLMIAVLSAAAGSTAWAQEGTVGERVYVLGAVNNPGDFEFKPGMGAKEAFDLAGGLAPNADPAGAMLVHAGGEKMALNVQVILDGEETVPLAAGDTIVVKPGTIRLEGQVKNPGMLDLRAGMTAKDALALAGGPTEAAALAAAYITRTQKAIPVNLADPESKVALQPGDVLTVPELRARRRISIALSGGAFFPTHSVTKDLFGNSWARLGLTTFEPSRPTRWRLIGEVGAYRLNGITTRARLYPLTVGLERGFKLRWSVQPYVTLRAGPYHGRVEDRGTGIGESHVGLNVNGACGIIFKRRFYAEVRYDYFSELAGLRFDGVSLSAGFRLFDIRL